MGNSDLRSLAAIEDVSFEDVSGSVVAVDAHNWLYRYLTTTVRFTRGGAYTTADGTEVANLIGMVQGLPKFFEHDLTPVFVFDGAVTEMKDDEIEERQEQREQREEKLADAREAGDVTEVARLDSQTQRLTDAILQTTRRTLELLDVPVIEAPAEGRHRRHTWPGRATSTTSGRRTTTRSCSVHRSRSARLRAAGIQN